jgi:hypothetical protein
MHHATVKAAEIKSVLLGHRHVFKDMEPLTQKVLLAIAGVVEKDPAFVNYHGTGSGITACRNMRP